MAWAEAPWTNMPPSKTRRAKGLFNNSIPSPSSPLPIPSLYTPSWPSSADRSFPFSLPFPPPPSLHPSSSIVVSI